MNWEAVIGIEVHAQLRTARKLFCGDRVGFGEAPNVDVCPVCLGLPGGLPTLNPEAVRLAVRTAVAFECTVNPVSIWARKNYFYPDLPKGYQITQFEKPLAVNGRVVYDGSVGESVVRIRRIHMEEDAGKSVHDRVPGATAVDLNRAGTPLVEIVTEPDLHHPGDVRAFLTALRHILEFADVSDCNMEEGSLRADANVSIRPRGATHLGTKTEIKNVNSFSGIEKALEIEIARQIEVLESGKTVHQETLLWDDHRGTVRPMRSKEDSHDYRYFPDPDLPPLLVSDAEVAEVAAGMPELPRALRARLEAVYGLSGYDAGVLSQTPQGAVYFEAVARRADDAKAAANWVMGPAQALMNARGESFATFALSTEALAEVIGLVTDGTVSEGVGKAVLQIVADEGGAPGQIVEDRGLRQVRDAAVLEGWVDEVITEFSDEARRYRDGEVRLLGFLVGKVMRQSDGTADPHQVNELLRGRLG
ncbi:MAG: Asp-tRNA(Asn)/Glu-tRNA(Gln) amidotransferase subunit GatB [Gemmatimonadetes bacterium]|nr:Asp-tRNA(Asn)/Glu-tRNA(Gln) amidotransferase subunit GatB [Gemmatimonadota bacterium]MDA1103575.1 Asp-tRNA(Asn)/Glu-tRNA(Gln) amidotransferase subunit GatB [Gemmatimonadota bacterium]